MNLCIEDNQVASIVSLVRRPSAAVHPKVKEVIVADFDRIDVDDAIFMDLDIVYFCIGVYTGAVPREEFRKVTVDYPVNLAKAIKKVNTDLTFCLLSGQGADRSEKSKIMFAKDKGIAENLLAAMGFKAFYTFRPGYIYPSKPRQEPSFSYAFFRKMYPVIRLLGSNMSVRSHELAAVMHDVAKQSHEKEVWENKEIVARYKGMKQ
jgi:uncharacterized protein YbjT (DUF2867 family)